MIAVAERPHTALGRSVGVVERHPTPRSAAPSQDAGRVLNFARSPRQRTEARRWRDGLTSSPALTLVRSRNPPKSGSPLITIRLFNQQPSERRMAQLLLPSAQGLYAEESSASFSTSWAYDLRNSRGMAYPSATDRATPNA